MRLYNADPARVHVVPLGVEHAFFAPGDRAPGPPGPRARRRAPRCCSSSGASRRSRASTWRSRPSSSCARAGATRCSRSSAGPRDPTGARRSPRCTSASSAAGVIDHVSFVAPQAHQLLSTLDARGRRDPRAVALGELRPRRPRVLGLRDAGGGERRSAGSRPWSTPASTATPGRRARPRRLGRRGGVGHGPRARDRAVERRGVLLARRYTWRAAASRLAALVEELSVDGPRALLSERAPLRDDDALGAPRRDRRGVGRASGARGPRRRGRAPRRARRPRPLPLAGSPARRREGPRHALAGAAPAHGARRDRGRAGARGEPRGALPLPARAERRPARGCTWRSARRPASTWWPRSRSASSTSSASTSSSAPTLTYVDEIYPTAMSIGLPALYRRRRP